MNKLSSRSKTAILLVLSFGLVFLSACRNSSGSSAAESAVPAESAEPVAAEPAEAPEPTETDDERAERLLAEGKYDEAYTLLRELGREDAVSASRYERGVRCYEEGDFLSAEELLEGINYQDSERYLALIQASRTLSEAQVGDTVLLGTYEQDGQEANGREPIEWVVLDRQDNTMLLISTYALDCVDFEPTTSPITWKESTVRGWLNSDFYDSAFSDDEKELIASVNTESEEYAPADDNAEADRVFLLSVTEADRYLPGDAAKVCLCTAYARQQGSWHTPENICRWWLRSDGSYGNRKAGVRHQGSVYTQGYYTYIGYMSARPVVCLSLPG